ncbi:MAG: hypothetical protein II934_06075 [Prevotella sp.]|nr:hypothetical protein [Prevotella sp.]
MKNKQRNLMKKLLFSNVAVTMLMAFTVSFTLSSCSEEIVEDKQENQETQEENLDFPKDVTVFTTGGDETTRTSLDLNAYFYWTANDKIWVDVAKDGSYATSSDDMEMSSDKRLAKFIFAGETMNEPTYELTYTGINSTSGTKVTIPQDQSQDGPNDATSIGRNGDCATATATQNAKGQYEFTLQHKAHYLIFQPYQDPVINTKTWKVKKIEVISLDDEVLCGTYDFNKTGLIASSVQSPNTTITIDNIGGTAGVALKKGKASDNPVWYAVIAPATDGNHKLRIKYTIDPDAYINFNGSGTPTKGDIVIVKDLTINSAANKVTKIAHKMTLMTVPTNVFYMWDATAPYCSSSFKLMHYGQTVDVIPTSGDTNYTPFTTSAPSKGRAAANSPCSGLPNVNAATWYAYAGDPRWETEYPWHYDGDTGFDYIYTLGTWIKKWDVIVAENSVLTGKTFTDCDVSFTGTNIPVYDSSGTITEYRDYDGTDYRSETFPDIEWFRSRNPNYKNNGRPNDTSDYFFLPANDCINVNGTLLTNIHGCYWLSSAVPGVTIPHLLEMKNFNIWIRQDNGNPRNGRPAPTDWWK